MPLVPTTGTCWKDELGNHNLGTKAQNMHQLRVFGVKQQALYFLPLPSTSCQWFLCFGTRSRHQTRAPWLGPPRLKKAKSNFFTNRNILHTLKKEPLNIVCASADLRPHSLCYTCSVQVVYSLLPTLLFFLFGTLYCCSVHADAREFTQSYQDYEDF